MKPAPFEYVVAEDAADAVAALGRFGDGAKVLAGGQSLLPMLALRLARPAALVDINRCADLGGLTAAGGALTVGALARQRDLERWAQGRSPLFHEMLASVAHAPIRNRGTVVGNLVHADPASELPALLLCLDGVVTAQGSAGERVIPADKLYLAPLTTSLDVAELATSARFTLPPDGAGWGFAEVARRHGDFALVGCVAVLALDGAGTVSHVRLGFFGVGGTPIRSAAGEAVLVGREPTEARRVEAARAAAAALSPDGDLHATAAYRKQVAAVLAERVLGAAAGRCRRPR
ncbi:MAG TPA: FAD binding domain-containing protein [Candidatus Bathyarchaeia archaeon]|nr:FAD binding domain-containing protein [Candidatus Bathyarchaeia archaeon]